MTPAPAKLETAGLNAKDFRLYKREQAGIARRMLYPVTAFYTCFSVIMFAVAWRTAHPFVAIAFYLAGVPVWTFVEYFAHIYLLHCHFIGRKGLHCILLVDYCG